MSNPEEIKDKLIEDLENATKVYQRRTNSFFSGTSISAQKLRRYEFCDIFAHTVVIRRKTVKSAKNTICDTCRQNSRRYELCDIFVHTVVISRKMVKSAKNTICDPCAQHSRRYEFCDIFAYTVLISRKTVK